MLLLQPRRRRRGCKGVMGLWAAVRERKGGWTRRRRRNEYTKGGRKMEAGEQSHLREYYSVAPVEKMNVVTMMGRTLNADGVSMV